MARSINQNLEIIDQSPVQESTQDWYYDREDSSAFGRGVDQMQASLYGFATAVGQLTGFDAMEEWGEEGVVRNLEEMSRNPPEIHSWDDVDSLSDFGTYFLETLAEQAPQLVMDVALGVGIALAAPVTAGGSVVAGVAGRTMAAQAVKGFTKKQLAQIGKKAKRMKGVEATYNNFNRAKGKVPAGALDAAKRGRERIVNAASTGYERTKAMTPDFAKDAIKGVRDADNVIKGMALSNFAQNAGETQMNFMAEDIEAPGTALLAGAFKASLDTLAPASLLGMAKKANVPVESLPQTFAFAAKKVGGTALLEGGTEAVQTVVDHAAMNIHNPDFDMFDEAAMSEIWTAATKGAIVGGSLGASGAAFEIGREHLGHQEAVLNDADAEAVALTKRLAAERERRRIDELIAADEERRRADEAPQMVPESQDTINAQAEAINDPSSTKDTVEITNGSPMPEVPIQGGIQVETENGVAITTNPEKAQLIAANGGDEETMGQVLYNAPGGKRKANGEVVVAMDERGRPILERATNDEDKQADIEEAQRQVPGNGTVEVQDVENVIQARMANSGDKITVYGDTTPVIPLDEPESRQDRKARRSINDDQRRAGQQRLNESALLSAVNEVFKDGKSRGFALSVLRGEREIDPRVKENLVGRIAPAYQRILKEDESLLDDRGVNAELANRVVDAEEGVVRFEERDDDDLGPAIDSDEEVDASQLSDPNLIEGEAVAPVIRPRANPTRRVATAKSRTTAEARAEQARQANPKARIEVTKNKGSWQVVEIIGYDDRASAEANLNIKREANKDELVGEFDVVEEGGRFFVREQMVPDQLTASPIVTRNPEITPNAPVGQTTQDTYVGEVMDDSAVRSGQKRRLQEIVLNGKMPEEKKSEVVQNIERAIVTFTDADNLEHEVYAPDLVSLGGQLLQSDQATSQLDGDSWFEAAFNRGVAELRTRGWTPTNTNKDPIIVAGNYNFKSGTGKFRTFSDIRRGDRKNRARGQDTPQSPWTSVEGSKAREVILDDGGTQTVTEEGVEQSVDAIEDQTKVDDAYKKLEALRRQYKAAKDRENQLQAEGADPQTIANAKDRVAAIVEKAKAHAKTIENFTDEDGELKIWEAEEIQGYSGIENQAAESTTFVNPTDNRLQNDGITPVERASNAPPKQEVANATADPVVESDDDPAPRSPSPTLAEAASQQRWAQKVGDAAEQRALDAWLSGDPEQVEVERNIARSEQVAADNATREARNPEPAPEAAPIPKTRGYGKIGKDAVNFVNGILRSLGIPDLNVAIVNDKNIDDLDGILTGAEKAKALELLADPTRMAVFIPKGRTGVIIVKPIADRDMYYSTLGHEIGHGVYNMLEQTIRNPQTDRERQLQQKLYAAYRKDRETDEAYAAKGGFKEWFADKIAAAARAEASGRSKKAKGGLAERFFKSSAAALRKVFNKTKEKTHPRFHRNLKFENVIEQYRQDGVFSRMQTFGNGDIESLTIPIAEATSAYFGREKLREGWKRVRQGAKDGLVKLLDVDSRLRLLVGDELADMIYKGTATVTGGFAYWKAVQAARADFLGRINMVSDKMTDQQKKLVFWELAQELPDGQISEKAQEFRKIIKQFHTYLVEAGVPMEEVKDYFPRSYNIEKVMGDPEGFIEVMTANGMSRADATDLFETMTARPSYADIDGFAIKRLPIMFERRIDTVQARALMDAGYLNDDPEQALQSYVMKYTREAEHRKSFGGWHYLKGYHQPKALANADPLARKRMEEENRKIMEGYLERYGLIEPLNNTQRAQEDLDADFQRAIDEAVRRGLAQPVGGGSYMWTHPDAKLDGAIERAVDAKLNFDDFESEQEYEEARLALRDEVRMLVDHALDRTDPLDPTSPTYNLIGEVRAYESLRVLLFSGVASIPEAAAVYARARGQVGMKDFGRIIVGAGGTREEQMELARAIGVVSNEMGASMATELYSPYDAYGNSRFFRNMLKPLFKYNGNDKIVAHTRRISVAMGIQFIRTAAEQAPKSPRHQRYLNELGLDATAVTRFIVTAEQKGGFNKALVDRNDPDAKVIRDAIVRFVDESVLRPNAAERPTWASHPIGTFVFHLKTFAYSFTKNVVGGLYREMRSQYNEGGGRLTKENAAQLMLSAAPMMFVFLAFGAVSDELRERVKSLGEKGTFTDRSLGESMWKWFDRTGLITAIPFLEPTVQAAITGNIGYNASFALGPTASHLYDLFGDGDGISQNELVRSIPIVSQMPPLRNALYSN